MIDPTYGLLTQLGQIVFALAQTLASPILLGFCAYNLRGVAARWIVCSFWLSGGIDLMLGIIYRIDTSLLKFGIGTEIPSHFRIKIYEMMGLIDWWVSILFFFALLAFCRKMREQHESPLPNIANETKKH